jgi:hypothetical protein
MVSLVQVVLPHQGKVRQVVLVGMYQQHSLLQEAVAVFLSLVVVARVLFL